jgi:hypothetical protein
VPTRWLAGLLAASALLAGCLIPKGGTPVFVDMRAGNFWSGDGKLLEVSEDQRRCLVAVRDRALYVRHIWVDCHYVHAKSVRDRARSESFR